MNTAAANRLVAELLRDSLNDEFTTLLREIEAEHESVDRDSENLAHALASSVAVVRGDYLAAHAVPVTDLTAITYASLVAVPLDLDALRSRPEILLVDDLVCASNAPGAAA